MSMGHGIITITATAIAAVAAFGAAFAADRISGVDSLSIGNMAGRGADANRTVAIGTGAGAYMTGGDSNLVVGAAAGLAAKNLSASVGMGHYALRGATNCARVVAIGDGAFAGKSGLRRATWVNGQFYANGREGEMWIKADPDAADDAAPIRYKDGVLTLNASKVVVPGGEISGGSSGTAAVDERDYDWYVDAEGGDDDNHDGKTRLTAFRTLDRALWSATTNDTVRVAAGEYAFPSFLAQKERAYVTNQLTGAVYYAGDYGYAPYGVTLVAPEGPEKTAVTTAAGGTNPGVVAGSNHGETVFDGFSFVGAFVPTNGHPLSVPYRGAFSFARFTGCVFRDTVAEARGFARAVWTSCKLGGCTVTNYTVKVDDSYTAQPGSDDGLFFAASIMQGCSVDDSSVSITTAANAGGALPNWGAYNRIVDSTVRCGPLYYAPQTYGSSGDGFVDSLVLLDGFDAVPPGRSVNSTLGYSGCIVGIGTNAAPPEAYAEFTTNRTASGTAYAVRHGYATDCVYTNATAVLEHVDADGRAKGRTAPRAWYFYGRKSAGDRALRDALLLSVQSAAEAAQ